MNSLLIEGFRRGVSATDAELANMEAARFDTVPTMSMRLPESELRKIASSYSCSTKTLRRLQARGVDVADPEAVALHLAGQVNISRPMLESVVTILETTDQP